MAEIDREKALQLGRKSMAQQVESLQSLSDGLGEQYWHCARLLADCSGLVWVTAVGTSAAVGERFAHILTCSGARSMFLSPADGLHGHTGVLTPDDILVAMSRGGESREVNQMVAIANQRGLTTIAFVHDTHSTLAESCQVVLPIQTPQEHELMGYLATTSTVAFSAMCDALCAVVLEAKDYNPAQFAKTHPGGAVGHVLTSVQEDLEEAD
mgnify:CR=1 FL=1